MADPERDEKTSFREILLYMACLVAGLALLALVVGWVLTRFLFDGSSSGVRS